MAVHPPFRAEHIGSLLRPPALLALRQRVSRGEVSADELAAAEDRAIAEAVALQERIGLKLATDGEFRRRSYHSYFYAQLGDVAPDAVTSEIGEASGRVAQPTAVIKSKLRWTHPIHVEDLHTTVQDMLGIDSTKEIMSPVGRPIALSEGRVIHELKG